MAGAIVYWRANDRQRSRDLAGEVEAGIQDGRKVAGSLLEGSDDDGQPFEQR